MCRWTGETPHEIVLQLVSVQLSVWGDGYTTIRTLHPQDVVTVGSNSSHSRGTISWIKSKCQLGSQLFWSINPVTLIQPCLRAVRASVSDVTTSFGESYTVLMRRTVSPTRLHKTFCWGGLNREMSSLFSTFWVFSWSAWWQKPVLLSSVSHPAAPTLSLCLRCWGVHIFLAIHTEDDIPLQ